MSNDLFIRTKGLLGEKHFNKIENAKVCIVGLGGVGGTAFEALLRSGVKNFLIIDFDKVNESNLNRQILYTFEDIDSYKVDVAKKRALQINNDAKINVINGNINEIDLELIRKYNPDFIVDAIDNVSGKILLSEFAISENIGFIMSLGMANRLDPTKVKVDRLDKTTTDPLAKKIRYEIRKNNLSTKDIKVVWSTETPVKDENKLHSMIMVPSTAGLIIASEVIKYFK